MRRAGDRSPAEIVRAARVVWLQVSRASGTFPGCYASALPGRGLEFEESRPYEPGDDVRSLDAAAWARTGVPYVKHYRQERDHTLWLLVDSSRSMDFAGGGRRKSIVAAEAAGLLAAAAARVGDRVGLCAFDDELRELLPAARGSAHAWRALRELFSLAQHSSGGTRLIPALRGFGATRRGRSSIVILSDFRDPDLWLATTAGVRSLAPLAREHQLLSIALVDPHEMNLPRAGRVRIEDPERPTDTRLLDTNADDLRARYRAAFRTSAAALDKRLRRAGSDVTWLRSDRDPLTALTRALGARALRLRPGRAA